jgi:HAD superfamily hydrolase (TIGR01509 family)
VVHQSAGQVNAVTLRAVLFDHDGTLVDSEPIHFLVWKEVLAAYGFALTEEQYRERYAGVPTLANACDLVQRFGVAEDPATLADAKNAATRDYLRRSAFPLLPGVREAIATFTGLGLRLAVVTGASAFGVDATLRAHGLASRFAVVVSVEDVRHSKPAPDCYLLALERLGLPAGDCLAIEDTGHGLAAAAGAGIRCLALPTAMSRHHDFTQAAAVLDGMDAAVDFVQRLCRGDRNAG